jgi:hypothetical protein
MGPALAAGDQGSNTLRPRQHLPSQRQYRARLTTVPGCHPNSFDGVAGLRHDHAVSQLNDEDLRRFARDGYI